MVTGKIKKGQEEELEWRTLSGNLPIRVMVHNDVAYTIAQPHAGVVIPRTSCYIYHLLCYNLPHLLQSIKNIVKSSIDI